MNYLYRIYQLFIVLPLVAIITVLTALTTIIGCTIGNGHVWGYFPGKLWAWLIIRLLLLPVKVEGREHLQKDQSYVFVSNHQGAFDIFLIYGFLGRNFKWMMKQQLRKIPFVGLACQSAHHIFVDKSSTAKVKQTYQQARNTLKDGMSLVVFPEGARTYTGKMQSFKRGAFMLANELQLPIVPLTINGSFNIMPRMRDMKWVLWHPLKLTIHKPIDPLPQDATNITKVAKQSYQVIMHSLVAEYQDKTIKEAVQ